MRVSLETAVIIGMAALACDAKGDATLSDIRVVESAAPVWPAGGGWHVGADALVDIGGGVTEDQQLFRVAGALRLSDGTIVIANTGAAQLRYYSPEGRYVGAGGREGSGPGEFAAGYGPASVWRMAGDSVAAWDSETRRLSVFDARGVFGRSTTFRPESGRFPNPVGLLHDQRIITAEYSPERMDVPMWQTYRSVVRYDVYSSDAERLGGLVELPGWEFLVSEFDGQRMHGPRPFARISQVVAGLNGMYYTSADAFEVLRIGIDEDSSVAFRALRSPGEVRPDDIAAFEALRMANAPTDLSGRQAWERWFAQVSYPETFPTFRGLTVDALGNVWAQQFNWRPDSPTVSWVFDARGRWMGTVTLPSDFTPYDIGAAYVLGRWEDVNGVEHIRLYELVKGL